MTKIKAMLAKIGWFNGYGFALAVVGLLAVFWPVLGKYAGLIAPDSMPFFAYPFRTGQVESMLMNGTFTPHNLYWLLVHPLYAHELTYFLDSLILMLGAVYYLRTQRVHPLAAWLGGLALGFSGYTFTLFSAGHRGYFHMFSCAVWAFGLIARGFETRRLIYFALLGAVLAWGVPYQPDVLLLVGALAAAYVLWLTGCDRSRKSEVGSQRSEEVGQETGDGSRESRVIKVAIGRSGYWNTAIHVWPRFGMSVLVVVLAGFGGIHAALTTQIANRDAQIAGVTGKVEKAEGKSVKMTEAQKHDRWIFATNWSLPPEDMLEFIVPGVFGNDSMQAPYPYWGRLGRPVAEVFQKGRMMPNYRQHTVYLGLVPLLFALFAVFAWFSFRRTKEVTPLHPSSVLCPPSSVLRPPSSVYSDIPFWCGVWLICLVLAFGRYTPFYRLFYSIPYMGYIRAPVKFMHLVELSTAFLAGFGFHIFLKDQDGLVRRKLLWTAIGVTSFLLVGSLVALLARPAIVHHVTALGLGQIAEGLGAYTVRNFARATGIAFLILIAIVAVGFRRQSEWSRVILGCCLLGVLCLDQCEVARRYVRVIDLEPFYRENAVVKALKAQAGNRVPNVVNYAQQNATGHDWFSSSLTFNGIRNLAPAAEEMEGPYGRLFREFQKDPVRLWWILGAQSVIIPTKGIEGFVRGGVLRPLLNFEVSGDRVRQVQQLGDKTYTLAALTAAPSAPRFMTMWDGDVSPERQVEALTKSKQSVSDAPVIAGGPTAATGAQVDVLAERLLPGVLATRVRVNAKATGLLVFNERVDERQEVLVDNQVVPRYVADAVWRAVLVPAGEHEVVLRYKRSPRALLVSILVSLAVILWALISQAMQRRASVSGAGA